MYPSWERRVRNYDKLFGFAEELNVKVLHYSCMSQYWSFDFFTKSYDSIPYELFMIISK